MKCRNCNNINPKSALKCGNCNAPLDGSMVDENIGSERNEKGEVICKNCRSNNAMDALKCQKCNAPLDGSMILNNLNQSRQKEPQLQCKNCKTPNLVDALKCVNCNAPLDGSMVLQSTSKTAKKMKHSTAVFYSSNQAAPTQQCSRCFYPNESGTNTCLQCGHTLILPANNINLEIEKTASNKSPKASTMTINPWIEKPKKQAQFVLVSLESDGKTEKNKRSFGGEKVDLNRANLDKENITITSDVQASIVYSENGWSIENKSAMGTTFIKVNGQVGLQDGDIILMGNRLFKFKV